MKDRTQSGFTLVETALAGAIVIIVTSGALSAVAAFGKYLRTQGGPARTAALIAARQTLHTAQNAWKYGSPGTAPSGSQTIVLPYSSATTAPATITTSISGGGTTAWVTVTVQYTPEPGRRYDSGLVRVSGEVAVKAPLPGSQISRPGLVPLPSGAP